MHVRHLLCGTAANFLLGWATSDKGSSEASASVCFAAHKPEISSGTRLSTWSRSESLLLVLGGAVLGALLVMKVLHIGSGAQAAWEDPAQVVVGLWFEV